MLEPSRLLVTRRRLLVATAGLAGLTAVGGCALPEPEREPDVLLPLAAAADRDALELAAADATHGSDVPRLHRIAEVRRIHAARLTEEIRRMDPPGDDHGEENLREAPVCPPLADVRERLRSDARRAGEVAVAAQGYRAELAAAVAAACTAAAEVVLA